MRTVFFMMSLIVAAISANPVMAAGLQDLQQFSDAFAELAAQVNPAVVAVKTEKQVEANDAFTDLFRGHPLVRPRRQAPENEIQQGLGSGVIVSSDGYIVTNNHVIARRGGEREDVIADRITVELADLRSFEARVIGRDPRTDLAVLKIDDVDDLPFLKFADSDELDVGEWVVAIGNPFGQMHTVTTGIVSAVGRSAHLSEYEDYIQTDAAINPGNSGGALVNVGARLVGINTAIVSRSGGYQGIGFAIPANLVRTIMDQLIEHGEVRRGLLGVYLGEIDADMAQALGLESRKGALVTRLVDDRPAKAAGIKVYDVIIAVDGEPADTPAALKSHIAHTPPGTKVKVTLLREGQERTIGVTLAALAELEEVAVAEPTETQKLGMRVQVLTDDIASQLGFEDESGVIITNVQRGSAAARAGLQPRDLIVEINREAIESIDDYEDAIDDASGTALLMIRRVARNQILTDVIALRLPE